MKKELFLYNIIEISRGSVDSGMLDSYYAYMIVRTDKKGHHDFMLFAYTEENYSKTATTKLYINHDIGNFCATVAYDIDIIKLFYTIDKSDKNNSFNYLSQLSKKDLYETIEDINTVNYKTMIYEKMKIIRPSFKKIKDMIRYNENFVSLSEAKNIVKKIVEKEDDIIDNMFCLIKNK